MSSTGAGPPPAPQAATQAAPSARARADRPTATVAKDVVAGTQQLVRQELELARIELMEGIGTKAQAAGAGGAAAVLGAYLVGFLGLAAAYGLGESMALWAAFLVVSGVLLVLIVVLLLIARSRASARSLMPEESIARIQKELSWAKKLTRR